MLTAITRAVSPAIGQCELTFLEREPIDLTRAISQHRGYEQCLRELGARVISLPAEPDLPDSMFVEDPAVVVDEIAVMTRMGVKSRRGESASLARALQPFRQLFWISEPGTLEGGDVLRMERQIFVGLSPRTNSAGVAQLAGALKPFGYAVRPVDLRGCMHLKSGCSALDDRAILLNPEWIDPGIFAGFDVVNVASGEPRAANVLRIGETVLMPECFPETRGIVERLGYQVRTLDVSELMKAESGLTCSSLVFRTGVTGTPPLS